MASYLNPDPDTPLFGVSALKLWLKGDITTPDFLSSNNGSYADKGGRDGFSLQELHRALYIAMLEISFRLDPELECAAAQAAGTRYCIAMDVDEFYQGRAVEVKYLADLEPHKRDEIIPTYDRDTVCEMLVQAKEEIGWLESQGRRLQVHMDNAEEMKRLRSRSAFVFRPLSRNWAMSKIDKHDGVMGADSDKAEVDEEEVGETGEVKVEGMEAEPQTQVSEEETTEEHEKMSRKERLELFKREADLGFRTGTIDEDVEEGELKEQNDSPLVGLGVKEKGES